MNLKIILAVVVALLVGLLWFSTQRSQMGPQAMLPTVVITQGSANQIALVDPASGEIVRIDVGPATHGVGVLPDGSKAYAASFGSEEISVVDLAEKREIAKVNIGGKSHHVEISPDGRWAYFTVGSNDTVAVVDTSTDTLAATIDVKPGPTYTVFTPDGRKAYVTSMMAGVVSVIDVADQKVVKEIPTGEKPDHLAVTPDGRSLYVANRGSGNVSVIDTQRDEVIATIPVGKGPHGVAVVERHGKLLVFIGNRGETTISVIDAATNQVIDTWDLGASPEHLTPSPDRKILFIGSIPAKKLFVYDVERGRIIKSMDVGGEIHQIVVVPPSSQAMAPEMSMKMPMEQAKYELVEVDGGSYRNIDAETLWAMLQQKDFTLINVHIPYAGELPQTDLFIPYNEIEQSEKLPQDKDAKIVVYCRSGPMSAKAAKALVELGYTNVWNLKQGMREWQQAGYPLLDKSSESESTP